MLGNAIYSRLTSVSGVSDLVGTRVYPHEQPPNKRVYPLVVYKLGADEDEPASTPESALTSDGVSIACIAETYAAARALHEAVKSALNGQRGTWGGVVVKRALKEAGDDQVETPSGTDRKIFIIESTYSVWFLRESES